MKANVTQKIVTITPDMAKEWLALNVQNRPLKRTLVEKYKRDMAEGRWGWSDSDICFDEDGRMNNGQHRLTACIEAGVPFTTGVKYGLPKSSFRLMDQGKRTEADVARIAGIPNAAQVMAIVNAAYMIDASQGKSTPGRHAAKMLTPDRKLEVIEKNPRIIESSKAAENAYRACRALVPSIVGAVHYLGSERFPEKADQFVHGLGTGEGLRIGDPVLTLRNRMIERASRTVKERHEQVALLHILAWNAYVEGRKLTKLAIRDDHKTPKFIK